MEKNYGVVFTEKCKVELQELPMPVAGDDEVLIKSIVTQISTGTELTMLEANVPEDSLWNYNIKFPCSPGYSNIGEVIAVGKNRDQSLLGKKVLTGAHHVKYEVRKEVEIIPDGVSADSAVFAPIGAIIMASVRAAQIRPGETVAVFGAGLIGQVLARFAKIAGALNVFVFDVSDHRLSLVPDDKCFIPVNSKDIKPNKFIEEHNDGLGADVVFETTGHGPLAQTEMECVARNGKLIITSSPKLKSTLDLDMCNRRGITIIGAHNWAQHPMVATNQNRWTREEDKRYFFRVLEKGLLPDIEKLITHKERYEKAPELYQMLMEDRTRALAVHICWED